MHAVELLEHALMFARRGGYRIRQEWLDGSAGGTCEFGGERWLFVDLSLDPHERLEQVLVALEQDERLQQRELPEVLQGHWRPSQAA